MAEFVDWEDDGTRARALAELLAGAPSGAVELVTRLDGELRGAIERITLELADARSSFDVGSDDGDIGDALEQLESIADGAGSREYLAACARIGGRLALASSLVGGAPVVAVAQQGVSLAVAEGVALHHAGGDVGELLPGALADLARGLADAVAAGGPVGMMATMAGTTGDLGGLMPSDVLSGHGAGVFHPDPFSIASSVLEQLSHLAAHHPAFNLGDNREQLAELVEQLAGAIRAGELVDITSVPVEPVASVELYDRDAEGPNGVGGYL